MDPRAFGFPRKLAGDGAPALVARPRTPRSCSRCQIKQAPFALLLVAVSHLIQTSLSLAPCAPRFNAATPDRPNAFQSRLSGGRFSLSLWEREHRIPRCDK